MFRVIWLYCCVLLFMSSALWAATPAPTIDLTYTLAKAGKISLVIYRQDGSVARELLHAAQRPAGRQTEHWDGLDERGKPVAAGAYTWKLLQTQGLHAEYLLTVGTNNTPGWQGWPGNHGGAMSVAVDGTGMYTGTGCGEGTVLALKQTMEGKRLWTVPHWFEAWGGPCSMASDNGQLFMLHTSERVYRVDATTGEQNANWNTVMDDDRKAAVFGECSTICDLDARGGQLVISYTRQNLIRWLDEKTGEVLDSATIPEPYGVAVDLDGSVLVISKNTVVRVSRANKTPMIVVKENLNGPFRLTVDPRTREILVAEDAPRRAWITEQFFNAAHGDPATVQAQSLYYNKAFHSTTPAGVGHQVKRFSPSGRLVKAYGAPAGRQEGLYNPNDFHGLQDIAATPDGGFVVDEEGLMRRVALFDNNGAFVREWYGGWAYGQYALADPDDPNIVWMPDRQLFLKMQVDYQHKSWKLLAAYKNVAFTEWFGQFTGAWKVVRHQGQTYFFSMEHAPTVLRLDTKAQHLVPVICSKLDGGQDRENELARATHALLQETFTRTKGSYLWTDQNADSLPTTDEVTVSDFNMHASGFFVDDDLTYYFHGQNDQLNPVAIYRWPLRGWLPNGVPQYDLSDLQVYTNDPGWSHTVWKDTDGSILAGYNADSIYSKPFGVGFWSPRCGMNRIEKFDAKGKLQWTVGRHAAGSVAEPGEVKYIWRFSGMTHGCILVNDVEDGNTHVWDKDGLWVGRIFEDPLITAEIPKIAYEQCGENFGGSIYTNPKTGEVLYYGGNQNSVPIYRITGWDRFARQAGKITVTPETAAALNAHTQADLTRQDLAHIPFMETRAIKLDGEVTEWKNVQPLLIKDGATVRAKVYLAWNTDGLYAAYDVTTDTPWKSSATEQLAFQGGAAVDLNIGPFDPARTAPIPGDVRYVVAPLGGKATGVEFMPALTTEMSPPHSTIRATYKTLNGSITFERVAAFNRDWVAATPKADGTGYIVEMRVPSHAPLLFAPGKRFRLDVSVIFADPTGTKSVLRLPWHSRDAGDMATEDTYFESLLRPGNWGEAILE